MIVVADSTPLITLMKALRLDLLRQLFGEIQIPTAVFEELTTNLTYQSEADLIKNSEYIKVVNVTNTDAVSILRRATGLDRGECEAIVYADEVKANLLLMDEAKGRMVAQNMNLPITGSAGILIRAFKAGFLSAEDVEEAVIRIRQSNRHISERLLQKIVDTAHQNI